MEEEVVAPETLSQRKPGENADKAEELQSISESESCADELSQEVGKTG